MATDRQLEIIGDLEAAVVAIEQEGIPREEVTIGLLCDRAGHIPQNVKPIVETLKKHGDKHNLSRIRVVFDHARKIPAFLEDVKVIKPRGETPEFTLQGSLPPSEVIPPTGRKRAAQIPISAILEGTMKGESHEWEAAASIHATLMPFGKTARERIVGTISHFIGMGM